MKEIATALCQFQSEITNVPFDGTNPHFKNKYATLAGIFDHIRGHLSKNGLAISQLVNRDTVKTVLLHISGESLESETAILCAQPNNPQSYGSAVTYARRYSLAGILGISADDDDDAQEAATNTEKSTARPTTPASQNKAATAKSGAKSGDDKYKINLGTKENPSYKMLTLEDVPAECLKQVEWYAANSQDEQKKAVAAEYLKKLAAQ